MLRKLPERARRRARRAIGLKKRERKHGLIPFQGATAKAEQEIAEEI